MHKLAAGLWSICSCSELQNSQNTKIIKTSGGKDVKVNNIFTGKHEDLMRETKLNEIVTLMKQPLFKNLDKFSPPPKKKKLQRIHSLCISEVINRALSRLLNFSCAM